MTRSISVIAAALQLLVGAVALAGEQLQLAERALSDTIVHAGGKDDSVGNLLTFAHPVFDAANRRSLAAIGDSVFASRSKRAGNASGL
jgi:hypothetical protein